LASANKVYTKDAGLAFLILKIAKPHGLPQALVAPEERMSKPQLNARNCLNIFLLKIRKENMSFPSIVGFDNERIKRCRSPVGFLHTFSPNRKSMSNSER